MNSNILFPLSELEYEIPSLYKKEIKKYKGREKILNKKIQLLKCNWKDVLFFSAINPVLIFTALDLIGLLDKNVPKILRFPISDLKDNNYCSYQEEEKVEFKKINKSSYKEDDKIPLQTIKYFVDCLKTNEDPLIFSGIKHILYKGSLDITKGKVISYTHI